MSRNSESYNNFQTFLRPKTNLIPFVYLLDQHFSQNSISKKKLSMIIKEKIDAI